MNTLLKQYTNEIINFDCEGEINKICSTMREVMRNKLRRRGVVVAVSGGIDSTVCAALSVKAFGPGKVFLLQLPEVDSAGETQDRSTILINHLKAPHIKNNIADTLEAIGCYSARDDAIRSTFPEYTDGWKNKIVIKGGLDGQINHFILVVQSPDGGIFEKRLNIKEYLQIVAATNYKQRIRKTIEYYHADRLNYAVVGTPNRLEYDQGFFVKNGDGSADLKPIAHLYKTQVYALARALGVPETVCNAIPTTDTYSLPQGQDEFYFALEYKKMDQALWAYNVGASAQSLADMLEIDLKQAEYIYNDIETKRVTTQYLHFSPFLMELMPEIKHN
ncbi:MAG: NAD(+) synthase [Candidatus Thiodiazotropha sp. (ex Myrtea sp. 'scaly one' KF741663)]|nr:NAD(+) synthase [Candidatus Thiodiazotropha sp. (ex Myrtea sp. 'scaly one' KF741663)]